MLNNGYSLLKTKDNDEPTRTNCSGGEGGFSYEKVGDAHREKNEINSLRVARWSRMEKINTDYKRRT